MTAVQREYEIAVAYLDRYAKEIGAGEPVLVEVKDHKTYETMRVKAIIATSEGALRNASVLLVRNIHELLDPAARYYIDVLETIEDDDLIISSVPREKWEYVSGNEK